MYASETLHRVNHVHRLDLSKQCSPCVLYFYREVFHFAKNTKTRLYSPEYSKVNNSIIKLYLSIDLQVHGRVFSKYNFVAKNFMLSITSMATDPNNVVGSNCRDRVTLKNEIWWLSLALALALYGLSWVSTPASGAVGIGFSLLNPFTSSVALGRTVKSSEFISQSLLWVVPPLISVAHRGCWQWCLLCRSLGFELFPAIAFGAERTWKSQQ